MAFRKMLPLALLFALLVVPTAEAKYRVAVGDQSAAMFDSPRWQSLKLKRTRYLVPWDWTKSPAQVAETTGYMNRARAARLGLYRKRSNFTMPPVSVSHTSPGTIASIRRVSCDVLRLTSW